MGGVCILSIFQLLHHVVIIHRMTKLGDVLMVSMP